LSEIPNLVTIV